MPSAPQGGMQIAQRMSAGVSRNRDPSPAGTTPTCLNLVYRGCFNLIKTMRNVISTPDAPKAIGPYSQAIKANGFVFVSGQVAFDPATQQIINGDISAQTDRVLNNLSSTRSSAQPSSSKT
jgi:hypothetical protein